ncbi:hypothetical protein CEXT_786621 [Caerostris extrusa]|uniref:Secreted protein n=1 Tax=Caerostris extrusa TaxID=172846 RepID=A0AAV4R3Z0_CAEEX|nr:hypothetical protein CEXT_786621 [Caerostris extrusa]
MLLRTQISRYFWCCILCVLILASNIVCATKDKSLAKKSTVNFGAAIGGNKEGFFSEILYWFIETVQLFRKTV